MEVPAGLEVQEAPQTAGKKRAVKEEKEKKHRAPSMYTVFVAYLSDYNGPSKPLLATVGGPAAA